MMAPSSIAAIAARIKLVLIVTRRSAREAGLATGRGPDVIRNLLRAADGDRIYHPRTDTLEAIAKVLRVDSAWLLDGRETKQVPA